MRAKYASIMGFVLWGTFFAVKTTADTSVLPPEPKDKSALLKVLGNMQKTYENTDNFAASFVQEYTYTILKRTQKSSGNVKFLKPCKVVSEYHPPQPKSFIVDGKSLWIHQPKDKVAMVDRCFKQDGLTASIAFLWGSGQIDETFSADWFPGTFGRPEDHHVMLTPKTHNPIFAKLILVVDPKHHRVRQSVLVDHQGNVNRFIFDNMAINQGVSPNTFHFKAPKDTHVSPIPGSCQTLKKRG